MASASGSMDVASPAVAKGGMVERGLARGPWSLTEHGKKAEERLKTSPNDVESWNVLVREAQTTAIVRARMIYERVVEQFPTSGRYWRLFIEQEMRHRNYEQVEKLFQRCLMNVLQIDLWKCYMAYVRETKSALPNYREKMQQTYEFALEHVGIDFHSSSVWLEYLDYLKSQPAQGTFAEKQKVQLIRKAYQQAVSTPMLNIEQLWKEYCGFEQGTNGATAKKNIESQSRQYVNAKRSAAEYDSITRGLVRGGTSVPLRGSAQETQQLQIWKRYIAWEKSNPTRTEDQAAMVKRVQYAYEQCLLCFGYCADMWYTAALYLQRASETGDTQFSAQWSEEASRMFDRATTSGPLRNHLLIHFAHADFEECRLNFSRSEAIFKKLLQIKDMDPTLVYIQYMKFARRTAGIKSARSVFKQAREDPRTGHHVFIAAALMEFYISKDKTIAFKIFELGLRKFGDDPSYAIAYIDHLSHQNEDNNTRVLFEKVLSQLPSDKASDIWEKFVEFESSVGDLASLLKVERRRATTLKSEEAWSKDTVLLVDRCKYLDLMPCSDVELRMMGHPSASLLSSSSSSSSSFAPQGRLCGVGGMAPVCSVEGSGGGGDVVIVRPDIKQMLPFQPSSISGVGFNAVPGGRFPIPSAIANLLSRLPPPDCFQGPFVRLNELIHSLEACSVPETFSSDLPLKTLKRRRGGEGEESDDEGAAPPANDLYRSRQQKKVHTQ